MKNNVIQLYSHNNSRFATQQHEKRIRIWLLTIADTLATVSIGCCTLFCMYLAYTML